MDREQENSHLEWAGHPPPFLAVPGNKFADPLHFKTLTPIMTRGKTKYKEERQNMGNSMCVCVQWLSCVWLFATLWVVARQAPLSAELSRQEYWSGLSFPPPGDFPDPGIKSVSPACISCVGRWIFTTWATWEAWGNIQKVQIWQSWAWSRASDDLVELTWNFFHVNIGCCKQIGEGVPGERESSMTSFWSKTFCDLSLATVLALKQVSVINDLKGRKDCRNEGKAVKIRSVIPLVVQWLRVRAPNAKGLGFHPWSGN